MTVKGKTAVYGRVRIEGTESTVTLNMLLRRSLVEVSIPGELLTDFRQIQNNVADDLATIRRLNEDTATKTLRPHSQKKVQQPVRRVHLTVQRRQPAGRLKPDKKRLMPLRLRPVQSQQRECRGKLDPCRRV